MVHGWSGTETLLNASELLAVFGMCIAFVQYLHDI